MIVKSVIFACNHGRIGGDNISMLALAEGLIKKGINVTVIIPESGNIESKLKYYNIQYVIIDHRIKNLSNRMMMFFVLFKYLICIFLYKADVLHANDIFCNKYLSIASKKIRKKTICHVRFKINEIDIIRP